MAEVPQRVLLSYASPFVNHLIVARKALSELTVTAFSGRDRHYDQDFVGSRRIGD